MMRLQSPYDLSGCRVKNIVPGRYYGNPEPGRPWLGGGGSEMVVAGKVVRSDWILGTREHRLNEI